MVLQKNLVDVLINQIHQYIIDGINPLVIAHNLLLAELLGYDSGIDPGRERKNGGRMKEDGLLTTSFRMIRLVSSDAPSSAAWDPHPK